MPTPNFIYTIPSYNRASKQITVSYLNEIGITEDRIIVFVQTEEDYSAYKKVIGSKASILLRTATRGVEARNNILNELSQNNNIVMLDDDVRTIGKLVGEQIQKIQTAEDMDNLFAKCFTTCGKTSASMFGIYPVYNAYFMENTISTRTPVNTVFGFEKGFKLRFNELYDTKEDAELCARVLTFGGKILRFNFLAVDADHRKTKDGYIDDRHQEENIRCVRRLVREYPDVYAPQKNKPWEVRTLIKDHKIKLQGGKKR